MKTRPACGHGLLLLALALSGCAGSAALDSLPREREIRLDGAGDDWEGGLLWMKVLGLSVGARHDEAALYLAIATTDEALQNAILARGLTLWLDGAGGEARELGLRYPAGFGAAAAGEWRAGSTGGGGPGAEEREGQRPSSAEAAIARRARLAALPAEFLLLRGEDDAGRLTGRDEVPGLELAVGLEASRLLVELRLPFASEGQPLLALAPASGQLGLGLALGPLPQRGGPGGVPAVGGIGRGPSGGLGPGPGAGRGGPGGPPGGPGGGGKAAALNGWIRLRLVP
jgi:hypothetical protein